MSWIKNSLSCFRCDNDNKCECSKKTVCKLQVSDKNIQCNFDEEFDGERDDNNKGQ